MAALGATPRTIADMADVVIRRHTFNTNGNVRMSEQAATEIATATGNDYTEHNRTYDFFIDLTLRGTIGVAAILILMAVILL